MKKHGNQKYERKADTSLSLRVSTSDKKSWQEKAQAAQMSLNEWVVKKLSGQYGDL